MTTAKEKAIDWLESEAKVHKSADTYDTIENSFAEDIDYAIDKAISERTKEILGVIEKLTNGYNCDYQGGDCPCCAVMTFKNKLKQEMNK